MRTRVMLTVAVALWSVACGRGGDVVDPNGGNGGPVTFDGLALSAQVIEVEHEMTSVIQVTMRVTMTNTTNAPIVRSYPAGCPVLMRFYNSLNLNLAYDEGRRPCTVTTPVSFSVQPQESFTVTSGLRFPWEILGDSLGSGAYYAAALLRITGENPIEVDAGVYAIPLCEQIGTATVCN